MPRERRGFELEEKVKQWLDSSNAKYLTEPNFSDYKQRVDFLVTQPFQFAIEVFNSGIQPQNIRMKAKRLLAQRLTIAERFGPYLPFIVIAPDKPDSVVPFIDALFSIDNLPELKNLPDYVKLDKDFQQIFQDGKPTNIKDFSELINNENKSLSMEDLLFYEEFPKETLAEKLSSFLKSQIHLPADEYLHLLNENNLQLRSDFDRQLINVKISDGFNNQIQQELINKLGGRFINQRIQVPGKLSFSLRVSEWESPSGQRFIIRTLRTSQHFAFQKAQELYADAWIARAYNSIPQDNFILLIGSSGTHITKTLKEVKVVTQTNPIDLKAVNMFQSSGWNVFPWDFAEPEPSFIQFLRGRIR